MSIVALPIAISDTDAYDVTKHFLYPVYLPGQGGFPKPYEYTSRGESPSYSSGPFLRVRGVLHTYVTVGGTRRSVYTDDDSTNGSVRKHLYFEQTSPTTVWFYAYRYISGELWPGSYRNMIDLQFNPGTAKPFKRKSDTYVLQNDRRTWKKMSGSWGGWESGSPVEFEREPLPNFDREYDMFWRGVYGGFDPQIDQAFGRAYLAAANSLPQANVNLIANIKEAIGTIKNAVGAIKDPMSAIAGLGKSFSDPRNVWLSYRYVYKTTEMDVHELSDFVSRIDYLTKATDGHIKCQASDSTGRYTVGCTMSFPLSSVLPKDILDVVKGLGLRVTPSNMWDMIPFSFMADWFLGVGDKLQFFEDWAGTAELQPNSIWCTIRTQLEGGASVYMRLGHRKPVVPPLYTSREASGKVVTMRVADTISLFT